MRWLCRLITPPGGVILDFFAGTGSTGKAAIIEGFDFIGIEREEEYYNLAKARCLAARPEPKQAVFDLPVVEKKPKEPQPRQETFM